MQRSQLRLAGSDDREINGTVGAVFTRPLANRVFVQIRCVQAHYLNHSFPKDGVAHPNDLDRIFTGKFDLQ